MREDDDDDDAHNDAINDGVRSRMRRNDEDGHGGPRRRGGCGFGFVPALVGIGNVRLGLVAGSFVGAHVGMRNPEYTARHTLYTVALRGRQCCGGCFVSRSVVCVCLYVRCPAVGAWGARGGLSPSSLKPKPSSLSRARGGTGHEMNDRPGCRASPRRSPDRMACRMGMRAASAPPGTGAVPCTAWHGTYG